MPGKSSMAALALCAAAFALPAAAQGVFKGAWEVVKAEDAPWLAAKPKLKPHREPALRNARIEFRADRVVAPIWIGCKSGKYQLSSFQYDELFEGGLSDPSRGMNDPKGLALKMGFTGEPVPTLVTGCSELLFHLADQDTAMFALNNMIYTLKRRQARQTPP